MKLNELFPSNYLSAADLDVGDDSVLTMIGIKQERIGKDQEIKPLLYFRESDKPMVLNKTNAYSIGSLHGHDAAKWDGKQIALYATTVFVQGESKACIRVRGVLPAQKPNGKPAPMGAMLDDEVPF